MTPPPMITILANLPSPPAARPAVLNIPAGGGNARISRWLDAGRERSEPGKFPGGRRPHLGSARSGRRNSAWPSPRDRSLGCRWCSGQRAKAVRGRLGNWLSWVESGSLVIGHINDAARRWCPTSLLRSVGSRYSEEPWVEIL